MSDTSAIDPISTAGEVPGQAGAAAPGSGAAGPAKPPERPIAEIRADIERERGELSGSFARLRKELDEAADAGRQRSDAAGKRAKQVVPVVAGTVVTLLVARSLWRRRRRS